MSLKKLFIGLEVHKNMKSVRIREDLNLKDIGSLFKAEQKKKLKQCNQLKNR